MTRGTLAAALALALPVSSLLVACDRSGDTSDRAALERKALERDLDLALQPDTTPEVALTDAPLVEGTAAPAVAPAAPQPQAAAPDPSPPRAAPREQAASRPSAPAGPRYETRTVPGGTTFTVRFDN